MLKLIRNRAALVLAVLAAALCPVLMAPSGGFPSRPTFQQVTVNGAAGTVDSSTGATGNNGTATNYVQLLGNSGSANPVLVWNNLTPAANTHIWEAYADTAGTWHVTAVNDANSGAGDAITCTRVTITPTCIVAGVSTTGSFTGTLTGYGANPTGTVFYSKVGNWVSLYVQGAITATSNAASLTMTGLPAAINPAHQKYGAVSPGCVDGGNSQMCAALITTGNSITFSGITATGCTNTAGTCNSNAAWTAVGVKGIGINWSTAYSVD